MSTLALDLGTNTGFAILRADGRIESGTKHFQPGAKEGAGMRFVRFRAFLASVKDENPDLSRIVYESVVFAMTNHRSDAAQIYGGFLATLQTFAELHGVGYDGINVMTIKKQFAGHGKAAKIDVINQCKALGFNPHSDNEADAIALLHVATGNAPLLTMSGATPKQTRKKRPEPAAPAAGANPF